MARQAIEEIEDDLDDLAPGDEAPEEELDRLAWLRNTPFWAVSAILHLILIGIAIVVVRHTTPPKKEEPPIVVEVRAPAPAPEAAPVRPHPQARREADAQGPRQGREQGRAGHPAEGGRGRDGHPEGDLPRQPHEQEPRDHERHAHDRDLRHPRRRRRSRGAYGERWGKGSLVGEGGSEGTEDAVRAALEWLRRHQSEDGSWKAHGYLERCKKACQNANGTGYGDGRGYKEHDVGVTGLAMLAFAGYGHTHRDGIYEEYVECLKKAVAYMKSQQVKSNDPSTNGRFGPGDAEDWIYGHAIATMAMAELLVMSNDVIGLKSSVTDAVKLCLHAQNDGFGWRYGIKSGENDTSVTGWMVLALKTAKNARLDIPKEDFQRGFDGALNWFNRATASNGKTGYQAPGDEGSRLNKVFPEPYPYSKDLSCMTAVAVLCRLFAGEKRESQAIKDGVKILMLHTPRWQEQKGRALSTINMYYWYYGSYALFQFGGEPWKKWNEDMKKVLLESQRAGIIDEDGSWDPIDEWGVAGGRVYSTAICAMTLEVYYRFMRLSGKGL